MNTTFIAESASVDFPLQKMQQLTEQINYKLFRLILAIFILYINMEKLKRFKKTFYICLIALICLGAIFGFFISSSIKTKPQNAPLAKQEQKIAITILGQVKYPGTYYFSPQTTLLSALVKAGILPNSDLRKLNLKQPIKPKQKIFIRSLITQKKPLSSAISLGELVENGVGKVQAKIVFSYLQNTKPSTWSDIEALSGIGKITIETLQKHYILS